MAFETLRMNIYIYILIIYFFEARSSADRGGDGNGCCWSQHVSHILVNMALPWQRGGKAGRSSERIHHVVVVESPTTRIARDSRVEVGT